MYGPSARTGGRFPWRSISSSAAPIVPPPRSLAPNLPERYIAAKFYFSASFPDTPGNRAFIENLLARLAGQMPVVVLQQPRTVDDHRAYAPPQHLNLASVGAVVTPQNNLEVQTAVVAHAQSFVGTYGGFSYLAPLCGVRAFAFHAADEFYEHHRHLADLTFSRLHRPPLVVLPTTASAVVPI